MAKIIALYINELIKISKKISLYIILLIMLAGMFLTGGLLKYSTDKMQSQMTNPNIEQFMKSDMESRLSDLQTQLSKAKSQLSTSDPAAKKQLEIDVASLGYQIDSLNKAISMNIYLYTDYYVAKAIQDLTDYKTEAYTLQARPAGTLTKAQTDEKNLLASLIPRMEKAISDQNFAEYTAIINEKINANPDMSQTDKDIQLEQNNLRLKYNVTNEDKKSVYGRRELFVTQDDVINNIGSARRSLAYNLDFSANPGSPVPLTNERRTQITNNLLVYLKQLDTGAVKTDNFSVMDKISGVGIYMIELLLLILAGGAISQEISTGSIKSLIISPTKRWKIYLAKLLSLVTVGVAAAVISYFVGILAYGAFFGFGPVAPYIYASAGKALSMNFYLFSFAKLFTSLIEVAFYLILALMLSTLTRNTAASVGISIGVLFGGSLAYTILTKILTGEWLKFLPFANFGFSAKIFTYDPSISAASGVNTSLAFSTIYIIIALCLMFYIGLDSFNRRDIK